MQGSPLLGPGVPPGPGTPPLEPGTPLGPGTPQVQPPRLGRYPGTRYIPTGTGYTPLPPDTDHAGRYGQ